MAYAKLKVETRLLRLRKDLSDLQVGETNPVTIAGLKHLTTEVEKLILWADDFLPNPPSRQRLQASGKTDPAENY